LLYYVGMRAAAAPSPVTDWPISGGTLPAAPPPRQAGALSSQPLYQNINWPSSVVRSPILSSHAAIRHILADQTLQYCETREDPFRHQFRHQASRL